MYKHCLIVFITLSLLGCAKSSYVADVVVNQDALHVQQPGSELAEYAVYSTLIDEMYAGNRSKPVSIFNKTTVNKLPSGDLAETLRSVSERISGGIAPEILDDFVAKNKQPRELDNRLKVEVEYVLLSSEDIDRIFHNGGGWNEYYASYRGRGIIDFSSVGFNREMNRALVYTSIQSGPRTGIGYYVLLAKEDGSWIIKHKSEVWVS